MKDKIRILIVEDEPDLRRLYVNLLNDNRNYEVTSTEDGNLALDILKTDKQFDLLLLDEILPTLKGSELIKILKEDKSIKTPKRIVLITNLDNESMKKIIKKLDFKILAGYIIKSEITPIDFMNKIASLI